MLDKHRIGFVIALVVVLVVVLGLISTTLAGVQSTLYLPLATSDGQTGAQPAEQAEFDDSINELAFEALERCREISDCGA